MLDCLTSFLVITNRLIFWFGCSVLLCKGIRLVDTALFTECIVDADCKGFEKNCCGHRYFATKQRRCTSDSCLHHYCTKKSDCGNSSSWCCRSNKCERYGCSCKNNSDCFTDYFCCLKSLLSNSFVCAASCVGKPCRSNDECAESECCRTGKCVSSGCYDNCTSHTDCVLGQYCCQTNVDRRKLSSRCSESCIGEICTSDSDCGPRNLCCISNKCSDRGCSRCSTNSDCTDGNVCCTKRYPHATSECSTDCLGKSCDANMDCGGADEECNSKNKCVKSSKESSFESWRVILILPAFAIVIAACCHFLRRRNTTSASQVYRGTLSL